MFLKLMILIISFIVVFMQVCEAGVDQNRNGYDEQAYRLETHSYDSPKEKYINMRKRQDGNSYMNGYHQSYLFNKNN